MKKTYSVLIVEDHPSAIEGYVRALFHFGKKNKIDFNIEDATTCSEAFAKTNEKAQKKEAYDLVFLDLSLPKDLKNNIHNGEMLGVHKRQLILHQQF
jgi:CheY-like chemotaxis protein